MALEWGGLTAGLPERAIDVAIAGQSMTAERMAEVDMAGPLLLRHHRVRHHRGRPERRLPPPS